MLVRRDGDAYVPLAAWAKDRGERGHVAPTGGGRGVRFRRRRRQGARSAAPETLPMLLALVLSTLCAPVVLPDRGGRVGRDARSEAVGTTPALDATKSSDTPTRQATARQAAAAAAALTTSAYAPITAPALATAPAVAKSAPRRPHAAPTTAPTTHSGRRLRRHGPAHPNGGAAQPPAAAGPKTIDHGRRARRRPRGAWQQPVHLQVHGAPGAHVGVQNNVDDHAGHTKGRTVLL